MDILEYYRKYGRALLDSNQRPPDTIKVGLQAI